MHTKNNSITIWRIVFTYLILIFHFDNRFPISGELGLLNGWYIAVEFFFIVTGYLLYDRFDVLTKTCHSGWDYFVYRYKKIYPYYLGAFLFSLTMYVIAQSKGIGQMIKLISYNFFEALGMHGIGLDMGWNHINNTSWFISVMFISGFIIFHCLVKWKDNFINFVAPLIIIIAFSYLYRNMGGLGAVVQIEGVYTHWPLMRGLADMCLGIFAARLNTYIIVNCKKTGLIRVAGCLLFLFVIAASLKFGNSVRDFLFALLLTIAVAIGFLPSKSRVFDHKWIHYWSGITLSIYLLHDPFRAFVFPIFFGELQGLYTKLAYMVLYMIVVTLAAIIFDALIKWCVKMLKRLVQKAVG